MEGKLKKTLKEKCPYCGSVLQIRAKDIKRMEKGMFFYVEEEFISCSNKGCSYKKETYKPNIRKRYYQEK